MGYPVWQTQSGDLGKITAQEYFDLALLAVDPDELGTISYKLVAGQLPRGLQLSPNGQVAGNPEKIYVVQGVPFNTNKDVTSEFTIRATNSYDNLITDRTFNITITGNFPPQILTQDNPLGTYLDGTQVNKQLEAFDLNNDILTWSLNSGSLPPGLTLDTNGLISGVIQPQIYTFSTSITGWDDAKWDNNPWQFTARSNSVVYNFVAAVTDGKATTTQKYSIAVYAHNDLRADSDAIYADNANIFSDADQNRPAVLLTTDLGDFSTVNSGGYFAFKFEAVDYDNTNITYNINTGTGYAFDEENFDMDVWDRSLFNLPLGLTLDANTGWLTGYIPAQVETIQTYQFGIYVYGNNDPTNSSPTRLFTLNILGNLDLAVDWITPSDLGYVDVGAISNLSVVAKAANGRELTYSLAPIYVVGSTTYGSKLPQGLTLLPDGTLSGRVSFQAMGFDKGQTTFDKDLAAKFVYTNNTNFDNTYSFAVIANDYFNQVSGEQVFTVRLKTVTYEPYENLYARCLPSADDRQILQQIVNNTDIFDPADVYRPKDPYYGAQIDLKFLVSYGIKASAAADYIAAMKARHFDKKFYFGDFKLAQGKDSAGNILYEVVYVDLIEDTKIYETVNGISKNKIPAPFTNINITKSKWRNPRAISLPQNQIDASSTLIDNRTDIQTNSTYYLNESLNVIAPNDLTLMQADIANNLENTYLNSLPEWMVSVQSDGKIIGYTTGAPVCYLKPGTGAKALYNIKRFVPFDIKSIPFVVDRYVLNDSYSTNFDVATRKFVAHKYTTFDITRKGNYTLNGNQIVPAFFVDFAVDRPFDSIDGKTVDYILNTGGLDGISYNLDGKYLIFATQEAYVGWPGETNDGWNKYQGGVIPGYLEKVNTGTLPNQRGGVWQITVNATNQIILNFIQEISPGQVIYVGEGVSHANSYQLYDIGVLSLGYTVPHYRLLFGSVYQPIQQIGGSPTTFDGAATQFINNVDTYTIPLAGDKYLKFPKIGVFTNDQ
jgi:hypothetical protein